MGVISKDNDILLHVYIFACKVIGGKTLLALNRWENEMMWMSRAGGATLAFAIMAATGSAAAADTPYGTAAEAASIAGAIGQLTESNGVEAVIGTLGEPGSALNSAPMAIIVKELTDDNTMLIRVHNKFPEINDMDFTDVQDLDGNYIFADTLAALDAGDPAMTNFVWPRFDDDRQHAFECLNRWLDDDQRFIATICR